MNEIDSSLDTGQGAWQTQKAAIWNRSRRDRPISRELSVAWLDRSPISRLWRPVLYLQRAPDVQIRTSYVKAFGSYRITDIQTNRHDRNYIPLRFADNQ